MEQFALMNPLDVWYYRSDVETILAMLRGMAGGKKIEKRVEEASARASKRTRIETFPKLAEAVNGQYHIKDEPPLIFHYDPLDTSKNNLDTGEWRAMVRGFLASMPEERRIIAMRYRGVDLAQKVVGVGSVGTRCAIMLCLGGAEGDDPLIMQLKEASASVLEPYLGASPHKNHGERVVVGQHMMQAARDIFLCWYQRGAGASPHWRLVARWCMRWLCSCFPWPLIQHIEESGHMHSRHLLFLLPA